MFSGDFLVQIANGVNFFYKIIQRRVVVSISFCVFFSFAFKYYSHFISDVKKWHIHNYSLNAVYISCDSALKLVYMRDVNL